MANKYVGDPIERMPKTNTKRNRKQRGSGLTNAPLSYLDVSYKEPSGPAGSIVNIFEAGLARPALNMTGGARTRRSVRRKGSRKVMRGGFYPGVMGAFIQNAKMLIPAAGVSCYRMFKNFNKTRKNRY
jgi:hypothetical protein